MYSVTYQTEVQEYLLDLLYMFATATDNLPFEHSLEDFRNKTLTLHTILNMVMVTKASLN